MSTACLAPDARERLAKLCGLLGSEHAGERAAAAQKATELLAANKMTWHEALEPVPAVVVPPTSWRAVVDTVLRDHRHALYPAEVPFLMGLRQRSIPLTPKQAAWLEKICHRCGLRP